ncbi:hypothetical protein [Streptomyces oceani]|uniref:Uncharacterized protein n=1 Tax=Streptomyces oceani TaxID=1075402 RepID=A0A1E7KMI0_9ACTN|nr:hypothetical protein [Streptomyces oceani]OEV05189.1 hypothetical protein AN216_04240 [Streptomyces oceani]
MDTPLPHLLLTADTVTLLLVCSEFLLHPLGGGLHPRGMGPWFDAHSWLPWMNALLVVASALAASRVRLPPPYARTDR